MTDPACHEELLGVIHCLDQVMDPDDPDDQEEMHDNLVHLHEAWEEYKIARLHWQVAWTTADEAAWLDAAYQAETDYPF